MGLLCIIACCLVASSKADQHAQTMTSPEQSATDDAVSILLVFQKRERLSTSVKKLLPAPDPTGMEG